MPDQTNADREIPAIVRNGQEAAHAAALARSGAVPGGRLMALLGAIREAQHHVAGGPGFLRRLAETSAGVGFTPSEELLVGDLAASGWMTALKALRANVTVPPITPPSPGLAPADGWPVTQPATPWDEHKARQLEQRLAVQFDQLRAGMMTVIQRNGFDRFEHMIAVLAAAMEADPAGDEMLGPNASGVGRTLVEDLDAPQQVTVAGLALLGACLVFESIARGRDLR